MIIRESSMSKASQKEPNWPPKSPHEALLSSPRARRNLQRQREELSPSPSPLRRPSSIVRGRLSQPPSDDDEDEDEETLQLKLQAIEARLKLKKLQKGKEKRTGASEADAESIRTSSRASIASTLRRVDLPRPQSSVLVPLSPVKETKPAPPPKSPARVLLGIDKGMRAKDVSLKRAPSLHSRTNSLSRLGQSSGFARDSEGTTPRPKSFSERIAESRSNDKERKEKAERLEKFRSRGFGQASQLTEPSSIGTPSSRASSQLSYGSSISEARKYSATPGPTRSLDDPFVSRSRSMSTLRRETTSESISNATTRSTLSSHPLSPSYNLKSSTFTRIHPNIVDSTTTTTSLPHSEEDPNSDSASTLEPFTGLHLSKRLIEHKTLTRHLEGRSLYPLPLLLKTVKGPQYDPPDCESDYVVLGIIASKSSPLDHRNKPKVISNGDRDEEDQSAGRAKFMVLRITDLKWEVDLYLFDTGFSAFWKLPVGAVIAILNPDIMPPRDKATGAFGLKIASSDDTILEIGRARDLGLCKAVKKDGKGCTAWIDARKTEYCEFHVNLQVEKSKRGRMEVNTMVAFGSGSGGSSGRSRFGMFGGSVTGGKDKQQQQAQFGRKHDLGIHETVYIAPSTRNTAQLLDNDEADSNAYERGYSRAELHRKRLAEKEKERDLARKLGEVGSGMGSEYMRLKGRNQPTSIASSSRAGSTPGPTRMQKEPVDDDRILDDIAADGSRRVDAESLGLLGKRAIDVTLSPVKRKRGGQAEPMGWSKALKRDMIGDVPVIKGRQPSPSKKKARLLLEGKGIREPGRESLGGIVTTLGNNRAEANDDNDDDDDDLEII